MTIIDSSAILGLLFGEQRATPIVGYLPDGGISTVNLAEVVGKLADSNMPVVMAADLIHRLSLRVIDFGEDHALLAGELTSTTSHLGLSLGDRACLATGLLDGDRIVTLDRAWSGLEVDVPITVLM